MISEDNGRGHPDSNMFTCNPSQVIEAANHLWLFVTLLLGPFVRMEVH